MSIQPAIIYCFLRSILQRLDYVEPRKKPSWPKQNTNSKEQPQQQTQRSWSTAMDVKDVKMWQDARWRENEKQKSKLNFLIYFRFLFFSISFLLRKNRKPRGLDLY